MRVLVVDAVSIVRTRLVARLVEHGLAVVAEATSSQLARAYAASHAPDAIVLDVELPDRGGLALLGELPAIAPAAKLVVLTNALPYRRHCMQLGAHAFLDKSADFDRVAGVLAQLRSLRTGT